MSHEPKHEDLMEQVRKILDPVGPPSQRPVLTPAPPSTKEEQHVPYKEKKSSVVGNLGKAIEGQAPTIGKHFQDFGHHYDLAGLGVLAAPVADEMREAKQKGDRRGLARSATELTGLGILAAPSAAHVMKLAMFDELDKLGAISDEQARRSLDRLDTLEQNRPGPAQMARYTLTGAIAGPTVGAIGNAIAGHPQGGKRAIMANAVKGALTAGAVPLVQRHLDRTAEKKVLQKYLAERQEKTAAPVDLSPAKGLKRVGQLLSGTRVRNLKQRAEHLTQREVQIEPVLRRKEQEAAEAYAHKRSNGGHINEARQEKYKQLGRVYHARNNLTRAQARTQAAQRAEATKVTGARVGVGALVGGATLAQRKKDKEKTAAELSEAVRSALPKKDFAVPASKSNTGEKAYPIPDRQHARSALGFAKMHGDTSDYERVRAKVKAKYPDMLKGEG